MRVAMLSLHSSPLARLGIGSGGGMNVYVREISRALALLDDDIEVDIYTATPDRGDGESHADVIDLRSGMRVRHIGIPTETSDIQHAVATFAQKVGEYLERAPADVLHAHYWLSGIAGHCLKHRFGIPLVSTFHTLARVKTHAGITTDDPLRAEEEHRIMGCSDAIVVSSEHEECDLRAHYDVNSPVIVLPPGIDHDLFHPGSRSTARQLLDLNADDPVLVTASRIQRIKGIHWALDVVASLRERMPNVQLLVIGGPSGTDGERTLHELRARVNDECLHNNVHFLGPKSPDRLVQYLRAANVFLMPSYSESFGLAAIESAAVGTPVLASDVGGLRAAVKNGESGYLIERGDTNAFADAAWRILHDAGLAHRMRSSAMQWAKRFRWQSSAEQLRAVYEQAVATADATSSSKSGLQTIALNGDRLSMVRNAHPASRAIKKPAATSQCCTLSEICASTRPFAT